MTYKVVGSLEKEKGYLSELANAYKDQGDNSQISEADIREGQAILDKMHLDDAFSGYTNENLAAGLNRINSKFQNKPSSFAVRIWGDPKTSLQVQVHNSKEELVNVLSQDFDQGKLSVFELYEMIPQLLDLNLLPDAWDASKLYPSAKKIHPDRVVPLLLSSNQTTQFFEALSLARIIYGSTQNNPAAQKNCKFLEAYLDQSLKYQMTDLVPLNQKKLHDFDSLILKHTLQIDADALDKVAEDTLEKTLNIEAFTYPGVNQASSDAREMLLDLLYGPDPIMVATALHRLSHQGFFNQYPETLDRMEGLWSNLELPLEKKAKLMSHLLFIFSAPFSVDQGDNPTCQSARGISILAQKDPYSLIDKLEQVLKDGVLKVKVDNKVLTSQKGTQPLTTSQNSLELDEVSKILVPHWDWIYRELLVEAASQTQRDPHLYANPWMYGSWIPTEGFADRKTMSEDEFNQNFYQVFHPDYRQGRSEFPIPVGVSVQNPSGNYLGNHAVSIQRIEKSPDGDLRVYFFNPHFEDEQRWGEIQISTWGSGEESGESSMSFEEFVQVVNAFPYRPSIKGHKKFLKK